MPSVSSWAETHLGFPSLPIWAPPTPATCSGRGSRTPAAAASALFHTTGPATADRRRSPTGRSPTAQKTFVRSPAAFGIDRLAVWGISGGGPHALACAALLPDLVCAVASLASIAPYGAEGLDFFTGMGQDNLDDMQLFLADRAAARQKSDADREELLQVSPEQLVEAWTTLLSAADVAALTPAMASYLVACVQDGLAPGGEGWWEDAVAHLGPWGFDLADIAVPVQVWHGAEDRFVPFQHGQWLAEHVPGAEAHLSTTEGHLTLFNQVSAVHGWLLGHF